eukprot:364656-Chlamydomonas_euryale.AAC.5
MPPSTSATRSTRSLTSTSSVGLVWTMSIGGRVTVWDTRTVAPASLRNARGVSMPPSLRG